MKGPQGPLDYGLLSSFFDGLYSCVAVLGNVLIVHRSTGLAEGGLVRRRNGHTVLLEFLNQGLFIILEGLGVELGSVLSSLGDGLLLSGR